MHHKILATLVLASALLLPIPSSSADDAPELILAQALVAEGGFNLSDDHRAIVSVLRYRQTLPAHRRTLADVARAYCAIFRARVKSERQARILALKWEQFPAGIRALARMAVEGAPIANPCMNLAIHWGSRTDSSPLPIVDCGNTGNIFRGPPL